MNEIIKYIVTIFLLDQFLSIIFKRLNPKRHKFVFISIMGLVYAISFSIIMNDVSHNFYETFSVNRIFSLNGLKEGFEKSIQKFQFAQARNNNSSNTENSLQEVIFQYEVLSNEKTRLIYDKFGPEIIQLTKMEGKEVEPLSLFYTYRVGFLVRDGIFYFVFGIIIIAVCSDPRLQDCKAVCYVLLIGFYSLEASFLWPDKQIYDIFDYLFPNYALWQRIYVLKAIIGILCISVKIGFRAKETNPELLIMDKFNKIQKLQKKLNTQARSIESGDIIKNCSENNEFKSQLFELNKIMKEAVKIFEQNTTEKKKDIKLKRKWRIQLSVSIVISFTIIYYYANYWL